MKLRKAFLLLSVVGISTLFGQSDVGLAPARRTCPGDPATNLNSADCSFTIALRLKSFVAGSVTDGAMLSSIFFGTVAHIGNSPHDWDRGWAGYGDRVGSRYGQTLSKGIVEFATGEALRIDPRHVSYASDPRVQPFPTDQGCRGTAGTKEPQRATTSRRIGHAFMDFLTVRRSSSDGCGARLPNVPVFAGSAASAFVGDLWYPASARTPGQIAMRAGGSLGTALGASFYNEFSPEIGRLLGAVFKRRSSPPSLQTGLETNSPASPKGLN